MTGTSLAVTRITTESVLLSLLERHGRPMPLDIICRHMEGFTRSAVKQAAHRARTRGLVVSILKDGVTSYALSDATFLTPTEKLIILEAVSGRNREYPVTLATAAEMAGVTLQDVTLARMRDKDFNLHLEFAETEGTQHMEDEATRRAVVGVDEYVMFQGQICYEIDPITGHFKKDENGQVIPIMKKVYSDGLLQKLLGARNPARFKDQRIEHTGAGGGPLRMFLEDLPDD